MFSLLAANTHANRVPAAAAAGMRQSIAGFADTETLWNGEFSGDCAVAGGQALAQGNSRCNKQINLVATMQRMHILSLRTLQSTPV
jgi:hypothetical protein